MFLSTKVQEVIYEGCREAGATDDDASSFVDQWLKLKVTQDDEKQRSNRNVAVSPAVQQEHADNIVYVVSELNLAENEGSLGATSPLCNSVQARPTWL